MSIKKGTTLIAADGSPYWGSLEGNISDQTDLNTALNSKAPTLSPNFTGIPTAPTAAEGTNTNQIATTAFVKTAIHDVDALPDQTDMEGKYLATDGVNAYWKSPAGLPLLAFVWSDHLFNDASFLKADTFSWQNGGVYKSAYNHLVEDFNAGELGHSDTVNGITVYYRLCPDGHKVCLVDQEQNIMDMYASAGIAWYYILDTTNMRFKLPRTKQGFVGLRNTAGDCVIEGTSTTNLQPKSTEMNLYFYVGNTIRNETEVDIGTITESLNNKIDIDFSNANISTKSLFVGWMMPDYNSGVDIKAYSSSSNQFSSSLNGWVCLSKSVDSNIFINNTQITSPASSSLNGDLCFIPLSKNSTYYGTGTINIAIFYPCVGG